MDPALMRISARDAIWTQYMSSSFNEGAQARSKSPLEDAERGHVFDIFFTFKFISPLEGLLVEVKLMATYNHDI